MSISAFGVEHGDFAKAYTDPDTGKKASVGRRVTAGVFPAIHPLVAGKKGKKLRAFGNEAGSGIAGGFVGSAIGGPVVGLAAQGAATQLGVNRNQRKGYLKRED